MKKLLLISAAIFTLVSCSKTEIITPDEAPQEMTLNAVNYTPVKATYGPVENSTLDGNTDETMTIFGFYSSGNSSYNYTNPYFDGIIFKYQGTEPDAAWKGWDPTLNDNAGGHQPYYWPSIGNMKFLAVYPTDYNGESISYDGSTNTITIGSVDLSTFGNQKDIMYSNDLYEYGVECSQSTAKQRLTFNHLLSQIVVAVKPSVANTIIIKEVKILDALVKGDITIKDGTTIGYPTYNDENNKGDVTYSLSDGLTNPIGVEGFTLIGTGALAIPCNHNCSFHSFSSALQSIQCYNSFQSEQSV